MSAAAAVDAQSPHDWCPPAPLDRRFEALIFDWDGTAVPDWQTDASAVRREIEDACRLGLHVAIVSGTNVEKVDGQLGARPTGPGRLYLLLNRGSEAFIVGPDGPCLLERRSATPFEDEALDRAAELTVGWLSGRGLEVGLVSQRLNRRRIDLLPGPEWADPPKARLDELLEAVEARLRRHGLSGRPDVVQLAVKAASVAGLQAPKLTSDAKHVEIGLTDKADSSRWIFKELERLGIGPGLALIAGDELGPLGGLTGGPAEFRRILRDQIDRRRRGEAPEIDPDPTWTVTGTSGAGACDSVDASLLTISDGVIGTRGAGLPPGSGNPGVVAAGVYRGTGAESELLPCPRWDVLTSDSARRPHGRLRRALDLRTGILHHEDDEGSAVLFSSLAQPGTAVLEARRRARAPELGPPISGPADGEVEIGSRDGCRWAVAHGSPGAVAVAAAEAAQPASTLRIARYETARQGPAPLAAALRRLEAAHALGFERLLGEHREAWARRWETGAVEIDGDPELQQAVRFCLFHLMASVADRDEAALGARGLSGDGYRGHVFWDSDVFVLPYLAATHPRSARALLEYRVRRLPAALAAARAVGRAGARIPWESAASGADVTPDVVVGPAGELLPVRTASLEEHVVADVAWAAAHYTDWTGDETFAAGPGARLLIETARYWASRLELDSDGSAHLRGVMGADEYHGPVDDSAYTNVMARWNLRRAAAITKTDGPGITAAERQRWLALADAIVDGFDPQTRLYEEFAGFFALEPLVIAELAPRPMAAESLLGIDRLSRSQVVKQADTVMLHQLVPDEVAADSLGPNLAFYEPRTAHGSSLSPGVHAGLFARDGQLERAVELLRVTARLDLDDVTQTSAGGLHLAAMGSVWQALAFGFAGVRPAGDVLSVDPHLPASWGRLELALQFRGVPLRLRLTGDEVSVRAAAPLRIALAGGPPQQVEPSSGFVALRPASGVLGVRRTQVRTRG